jgi:hypothetical protein
MPTTKTNQMKSRSLPQASCGIITVALKDGLYHSSFGSKSEIKTEGMS